MSGVNKHRGVDVGIKMNVEALELDLFKQSAQKRWKSWLDWRTKKLLSLGNLFSQTAEWLRQENVNQSEKNKYQNLMAINLSCC